MFKIDVKYKVFNRDGFAHGNFFYINGTLLPHGNNITFDFFNGDNLVGCFDKGKPVSGRYKWFNGSMVDFEFDASVDYMKINKIDSVYIPNHKNYIFFIDDGIYEGDFYTDENKCVIPHGLGKFKDKYKTIYKGTWRNGLKNGIFQIEYLNQCVEWVLYENDNVLFKQIVKEQVVEKPKPVEEIKPKKSFIRELIEDYINKKESEQTDEKEDACPYGNVFNKQYERDEKIKEDYEKELEEKRDNGTLTSYDIWKAINSAGVQGVNLDSKWYTECDRLKKEENSMD